MYAIVEIAGQQFKVEKEQEIFVHRLEGDAGSAVELDNVLLLDNDGKVTVGTPVINGAMVKAKIVEHLKGDKVIVFHKKRRKGYQKQNGHRQYLSKIVIEDILASGAKKTKKAEEKKEEVKVKPVAEKKEAKPKVAPKKAVEAKTEKPKAAPKKEAKPKVEEKDAPKKAVKKETVAKTTEKKEVKAAPKAEAKKETKPAAEKKEAKLKAKPKTEEKKEDTKS